MSALLPRGAYVFTKPFRVPEISFPLIGFSKKFVACSSASQRAEKLALAFRRSAGD
jgi:hypothetical protein